MPRWTEEQQLAIDKENTNIIVSAGAGSGKTAVLTARVIRKLKSGVGINHLLILTFTKKAAKEMKERIRKAIIADESIIKELDYLDSSYITTFDSFALSIVKKYSYLLNVRKDVKIADSSIIYFQKKAILDETFENLYKEKDEKFLKLISDFTIKDDRDIKKYIFDISNKLDLKYNKEEYLDGYIESYYKENNFENLYKEYLEILKEKIKEINDKLEELSHHADTDFFLKYNDAFIPLLGSETYDEIKRNSVISFTHLRLPSNSSDEAKSLKEEVKSCLDNLVKIMPWSSYDELKESFFSTKGYIYPIVKIIKMLDSKINEFKHQKDIYDFTDISKMAIRVLKENDDVKEELKYFFKEIMIDEYQDTSDLQEEFVKMIDNDDVYMVGDIKQSIYRFRNANPYLFKYKYDTYAQNNGGFKIDLTKNFRSRLEVIDNVNLIFSAIMNDSLGGADYKVSHKMIFGNTTYIEEGLTTQNNNLEIYNYEYDKTSPYSKEEIEIFCIAKDIKEKIESKYQIFDKDKKILRDITYNDFAILLDKSKSFDLYKKVFEYLGVPLTIYTSLNITKEIEISLIKNILKLIISASEKKYDTEFKYAFTSIARSYLFEYTDEEIFNYVRYSNYSESSIMKIVDEIKDDITSLSLGEVMSLIISKFSLYTKGIKSGNIENKISSIDSILSIAIDLGSVGYGIYEFYDYLENLTEEEYKLEVKKQDYISDSVKIMTIHASKGLEFSICYFASLHSKFNIQDLNDKFSYSEKYGIITPYYNEGIGKTFIKMLYKENYINEEISEKIRLFYVALTRAKEKMIMVTSLDNPKENIQIKDARSFLDMLLSIKDSLIAYCKEVDIKSLNLTKNYNLIKEYNYKDAIEKTTDKIYVESLNFKEKEKTSKQISKETKTLLSKEDKEKMEFGTKMHEVFEYLDFKNPNIQSLPISDYFKAKIEKFLSLINTKDIINVYKEYEFSYEKDDNYFHGIIDLILEYEDKIKIIDYKLKNTDDENYDKQIKTYKEYLSTKTNKKIETYLFSILKEKLEEK
mgnify:FL=1